jgi:hypothetical protein
LRPTLISKVSAKRARLSGEFKAAPDIRQNGPAAGSGYVLRSRGKVKLRNTASPPNMQQKPGVN